MSQLQPHKLNTEEEEYVKQMNERDRRLHEIAIAKLESSYFVKRTHGFKAWKAKQETSVPPASKK